MDSAPQAYAADAGGTAAEAAGTSDLSDAVQNSADLLPQDGRKIILNATLSIEALDFNATCTALARAAQSCGGYVSSTSIDTPAYEGAYRTAYYQFRIPAEQYSVFLEGAGSAGNLVSKQESTQAVTSAYVDVEARLKSLKLQEERLYAMMEQAGDLETLLAIQNQLTEVQYQIESWQSQMDWYNDQVEECTVYVSLSEVSTYSPPSEGFGSRFVTQSLLLFHDDLHGLFDGRACDDVGHFAPPSVLVSVLPSVAGLPSAALEAPLTSMVINVSPASMPAAGPTKILVTVPLTGAYT